MIALFTFGFELLARGVFAGAGAFGAYGVSMGAEGVIRLLPCIALAAAGRHQPGLVRAVPRAPARAGDPRRHAGSDRAHRHPGPEAPWSELSVNLGYLLGGSLLAQVLSYAPFLGAQLLATPGERTAVADFIVGLFLSRIPILLFQAVQAALLPRLAALVSTGHNEEFRIGMRRLVMVVTGDRARRRARRRDARAGRRQDPVREQVRPRQHRRRASRRRAAGCSSWR